MKILDKIFLKNRTGQHVFVELDGLEPALGSVMRRPKSEKDNV